MIFKATNIPVCIYFARFTTPNLPWPRGLMILKFYLQRLFFGGSLFEPDCLELFLRKEGSVFYDLQADKGSLVYVDVVYLSFLLD